MSDGITLAYQVMLPDPAKFGAGPVPDGARLLRLRPGPHGQLRARHALRRPRLRAGRREHPRHGCSGGKFDYFEQRQAVDGKEAIEWLTKQPWSNGRLGMVSKSYPGHHAALRRRAAPQGPGRDHAGPRLRRPLPRRPVPGRHPERDVRRRLEPRRAAGAAACSRAPRACRAATSSAPPTRPSTRENPRYNPFVQALEHLYDDDLFRERSPYEFADRIEVPTLLVEAWQDEQVGSRAANLAERFGRKIDWHLLASNGDHNEYYGDAVAARDPALHRRTRQGQAQGLVQGAARDRAVGEGRRAQAGLHHRRTTRSRRRNAQGRCAVPARRRHAADEASPPRASAEHVVRLRAGRRHAQPDLVGRRRRRARAPSSRRRRSTRDVAWLGSGSVDLRCPSTAPDTDLEVLVSEVRPDGQEVYVQRGWLRAQPPQARPHALDRRRARTRRTAWPTWRR